MAVCVADADRLDPRHNKHNTAHAILECDRRNLDASEIYIDNLGYLLLAKNQRRVKAQRNQ